MPPSRRRRSAPGALLGRWHILVLCRPVDTDGYVGKKRRTLALIRRPKRRLLASFQLAFQLSATMPPPPRCCACPAFAPRRWHDDRRKHDEPATMRRAAADTAAPTVGMMPFLMPFRAAEVMADSSRATYTGTQPLGCRLSSHGALPLRHI